MDDDDHRWSHPWHYPERPIDTCHLWKAGIPCLLYGTGVIRGTDEDDACVLMSEMVKVTRVLAVTALDVCRRAPSELAIASRRSCGLPSSPFVPPAWAHRWPSQEIWLVRQVL